MASRKPAFKYSRSRSLILDHVISVATCNYYGDNYSPKVNKDWSFRSTQTSPIGSLVSVGFIRQTGWYLAWVLDQKPDGAFGSQQYLLESVENGQHVWWSNISLRQYSPDTVKEHPEWRWTDKQHELNDRWQRVCYRKCRAYIVLPVNATFGDGFSVTLATRIRFGLAPPPKPKTFDNWRKVTASMMQEYFNEAVAEDSSRRGIATAL